jgi:hypothetical protein
VVTLEPDLAKELTEARNAAQAACRRYYDVATPDARDAIRADFDHADGDIEALRRLVTDMETYYAHLAETEAANAHLAKAEAATAPAAYSVPE